MPKILTGRAQAGLQSRIAAKAMDCLIGVTFYLLGAAVWPPVGIFLGTAYLLFHDAMGKRWSVAKRIMGVEVVDWHGGECQLHQSALRNLPFALVLQGLAMPMVGLLLGAIGSAWVVAECYVIWRLPSGMRIGDVLAASVVRSVKVE